MIRTYRFLVYVGESQLDLDYAYRLTKCKPPLYDAPMIKFTLKAKTPVQAAILAVGGPGKLAIGLNVSRPTVAKWRKRGTFPSHRLEAVAALTGIPVETLDDG